MSEPDSFERRAVAPNSMKDVKSKARFEAQLIEGHKGVLAALVPFDPEAVWRQKPFRLAGRRHGWPVKGTANGVWFNGYIGERWGRFFIPVDDAIRDAAGISVGDMISISVEPIRTAEAYRKAHAQSAKTTQPSSVRPDAIPFGAAMTIKDDKSLRSAARRRRSNPPKRRPRKSA